MVVLDTWIFDTFAWFQAFFSWFDSFCSLICYRTQPASLDDLQQQVEDAFTNLPQEIIDRAVNDYERRLGRVLGVDGASVELWSVVN